MPLLGTAETESWPGAGYFELVESDGAIAYGNPLDDLSLGPRPDGGLVISVSVTQSGAG